MTLVTVDRDAVPILEAGGPYHGQGSPDGGDYVDERDLMAMVSAFHELQGELDPPVGLGHDAEQRLLAESGLPAAGWVKNVRVVGRQLVADLKHVPRQVDELIRVRAYNKVSVRFGPYVSQRTGKRYPAAIKGLDLLGARLPAVRTLGDLERLYADDFPDRYGGVSDVVVRPEGSVQIVDDAVNDGRIAFAERDQWLQFATAWPQMAASALRGFKPNMTHASRNQLARYDASRPAGTPTADELYRQKVSQITGIPLEQVL